MQYNLGDTVEYNSPDGAKIGLVHSATYQEDKRGDKYNIVYLIDTGNNVRVDVFKTDKRTEEINNRMQDIELDPVLEAEQYQEKLNEIIEAKDLPKSKIVETEIRQPELIEVAQEFIVRIVEQ